MFGRRNAKQPGRIVIFPQDFQIVVKAVDPKRFSPYVNEHLEMLSALWSGSSDPKREVETELMVRLRHGFLMFGGHTLSQFTTGLGKDPEICAYAEVSAVLTARELFDFFESQMHEFDEWSIQSLLEIGRLMSVGNDLIGWVNRRLSLVLEENEIPIDLLEQCSELGSRGRKLLLGHMDYLQVIERRLSGAR